MYAKKEETVQKTINVYDSLSANRKKYLSLFPKLDPIKKAYIVKNKQ